MEYGVSLLFPLQGWLWFFWYSLLLMLSTSFIVIFKSQNKYQPQKPKLPPGPEPWPIVGNLPEMLANRPTFKWIHQRMAHFDTDIACIRLGEVHVVVVSCPKIAFEILKKQDLNFASRPRSMAADMISRGYLSTALTPHGKQWKKMRKILNNELISPLRLQWLHDRRMEEADDLVRYIYNQYKHKQGLVNLRLVTQHYCTNLTRKTIFGERYFGKGMEDGGPGLEEEEHVDAIFILIRYLYSSCVSDFMPCLRLFDLDGHKKMLKKALGIFYKYHDPIIEERIQQWRDARKQDVNDWLDILISLKDANKNHLLTQEEIKATIQELMVATVDNPSNAIEWAMAEMINQPEVLRKATEELDRVVGKERLVQESDVSKLNYVKACAREAFRLHPIAPFVPPHVSVGDTVVADHFIPKGSHVLLSRRALGRSPRVWEDPPKFKPERHLKSDGTSDVVLSLTDPDFRFISFIMGWRGCPGLVLGTSMTIMLLARLLHCFSWSVPPNLSSIDLTESKNDLSPAITPHAIAKPRLSHEVLLRTSFVEGHVDICNSCY